MVTFADLSQGLKDVQDRGRTAPEVARTLVGLGWVMGSESDAAGLVLTLYGRRWLTQIENCAARTLADAEAIARTADLSLLDHAERWGVH